MERPKVRKIIPANSPPGSPAAFTIRDPLGLSPGQLGVTPDELSWMRLMNGRRTVADIAAEAGAAADAVAALADRLGGNLMLDTAAYRAAYEAAQEAWRREEVRALAHGGACYPLEAGPFRERVDSYLAAGPGPLEPEGGRVTGLFAPHIDISIAGPTYAHAYKPAAEDPAATTFVILATAHFRDTNLFIATDKTFATPFGRVETDRELIVDLRAAYDGDLARDELIHKIEHSVEFQVVFLHALLAGRRPFRIVPILVSSFAEFLDRDVSPSVDGRVEGFVTALNRALAPRRGSVCLVAGVDFAHVGLKFGDEEGPDETTLADLEAADRRSLACAERADAEGFWSDIAADGNARRVCGLAPMYVALRALQGSRGETVSWGRDFQPEQGYAVTYAGAVFRPAEGG